MKTFELRWADVDANQHVMHSKYYELGAHTRMSFLIENGFTLDAMKELRIGPILFREECIFKREINAGEIITVNMLLTKSKRDGSRWSTQHELKKTDGTVAAIIHADLAWLDLIERKLTIPALAVELIGKMPKSPHFTFTDSFNQ